MSDSEFDRVDGAPHAPPSSESLLVDRHDFKRHMDVSTFLRAMHAAAASGDYDAYTSRV